MALNSTGIASAVAALSVTGVTIKDIDEIPDAVDIRNLPIMYPSPSEWMRGASAEPSTGSTTFGTPSARMWTFNRIFRYVYLHAPAGTGRGIAEHYSAMTAKVDAILEAFTLLDISDIDVMTIEIGTYGKIGDPAESQSFYGCLIDLQMRERVNP